MPRGPDYRPGGLHHPGDILFTSLPKDCGHSAIGVVLSGEGSDGALGIQALKQGGGATVAQYPESARSPSLPINAIETGCVRFVLRPNELARELAPLSGYASLASLGEIANSGSEEASPHLKSLARQGRSWA